MFQEEEIKRGMALLDKKSPGWERKVNPEKIDLSSFHYCILAQVYSSYLRGVDELGLGRDTAISHGFLTPVSKEMDEVVERNGTIQFSEFDGQVQAESEGMNKTWRTLLADRTASPV